MNIRQKKLPIAALERIDDLCADFERKWQSNEPPTIESVLSGDVSPIERDVLLAELIVLDIDYRRRRGETPTKQEYLDRFPESSKAINDAFNEGDKRTGVFEPPTVGRLAELFPSLEIIELIGAGGMGAVYKARQSGLDRLVALKILPEEFGHDVKFALRFTREARTLAKLSHPNIVSVYEFGNVEDTYYFLMEFVDGSTLRDVVKAGQLAPEHALAIVPHLCDALQYAHDKGIVHRDIKPENILIAVDGSVKIADFGLSRILGNESQQEMLTGTHQVMGTPRYMAPEQLEGSRGVDHRADIYSLGVVFYEMLTGELPIGRFAAPSKKVEIDVRLDEVVLRTLEKEPQRRYQHASQIKSDVQSITSTSDPALARTVAYDAKPQDDEETATANLAQQELAGTDVADTSPTDGTCRKITAAALPRTGAAGADWRCTDCARSAVLGSKYADSASRCERSHFARVRRDRDISSVARLHENPKNRLLEIRCRHPQQTRQPAIRLPACRRHHRVCVVADVDSRCRCPRLRRRAASALSDCLVSRRDRRFRCLGLAVLARSEIRQRIR